MPNEAGVTTLLGYHARRASLVLVDCFNRAVAAQHPGDELGPVAFSVLSLIAHRPGITSKQICTALDLLPPNLVGLLSRLRERQLVGCQPHPRDGRARGLHATAQGKTLINATLASAQRAEQTRLAALSEAEQKTLMKLLQKVYR